MLSKVFEWGRIVHPTPDNDFVSKRTSVVQKLVEELPKNLDLLLDCACAAATGIKPRFTQESELVGMLIDAVRAVQPAFPQALAENEVDLRVVCALTVGELADQALKAKAGPSANTRLVSAVVCAGLLNKPAAGPKHLQTMLRELVGVCAAANDRGAELRRNRPSIRQSVQGLTETADPAAIGKETRTALIGIAQAADRNAAIDREEVDTLWWAFNAFSRTAGQPFAELSVGDAAIRAGHELANLVLLPPQPSTKLLARRVLATSRDPKALEQHALRDMIGHCTDSTAAAISPTNSQVADLVRLNPTIFPFSWVFQRAKESSSAPALEKKLTSWDPVLKAPPELLARQSFEEQVALRLYEASFSG
jgi:GTPase-associated system helical domain